MSDISVFDLLQVKSYGDASKLLTEKVRSNTFALDKATACAIHNLSAHEDTLVRGLFYTGSISIEGVKCKRREPPLRTLSLRTDSVDSMPPSQIQRNALSRLSSLCHVRSSDANKSTASLMMYGELMSNDYLLISVSTLTVFTFLSHRPIAT